MLSCLPFECLHIGEEDPTVWMCAKHVIMLGLQGIVELDRINRIDVAWASFVLARPILSLDGPGDRRFFDSCRCHA